MKNADAARTGPHGAPSVQCPRPEEPQDGPAPGTDLPYKVVSAVVRWDYLRYGLLMQGRFMVSGSQIGCPRADQNLAKIPEVARFMQEWPDSKLAKVALKDCRQLFNRRRCRARLLPVCSYSSLYWSLRAS